eukprot:10087359-Lingulodinium_polyedra.AAC.1
MAIPCFYPDCGPVFFVLLSAGGHMVGKRRRRRLRELRRVCPSAAGAGPAPARSVRIALWVAPAVSIFGRRV